MPRAFLLIMAFCGFRPEEVRRIAPHLIHLDATTVDDAIGATVPAPFVIRATAKGGDLTAVPCPQEAVEGWKLWAGDEPLDS